MKKMIKNKMNNNKYKEKDTTQLSEQLHNPIRKS